MHQIIISHTTRGLEKRIKLTLRRIKLNDVDCCEALRGRHQAVFDELADDQSLVTSRRLDLLVVYEYC